MLLGEIDARISKMPGEKKNFNHLPVKSATSSNAYRMFN